MLLFLSALQDISFDIYEAAMIDGASSKQLLFYVTIPLLAMIKLFFNQTGTEEFKIISG